MTTVIGKGFADPGLLHISPDPVFTVMTEPNSSCEKQSQSHLHTRVVQLQYENLIEATENTESLVNLGSVFVNLSSLRTVNTT